MPNPHTPAPAITGDHSMKSPAQSEAGGDEILTPAAVCWLARDVLGLDSGESSLLGVNK